MTMMDYRISPRDREILRPLAERLARFAADPRQDERRRLWRAHNALRPQRPMVIFDIEPPMWQEIFDRRVLACHGEWARHHEEELHRWIHHCQHVPDDWVFGREYFVSMVIHNSGWGLTADEVATDNQLGAVRYEPVLKDEADIERIALPRIDVDHDESACRAQSLRDAFGDILDIRLRGYFVPWFAPVDVLAQWRGLQNLMFDLMDRPAWVHECLKRITAGYLSMLDQLYTQRGLGTNHDSHFVGSGGQGYVDELPRPDFDPSHIRTLDMWGQATAQIFAEVSPLMHQEFSLPYDRQWLTRFGLACYGCCEPLHHKVGILRSIPNLRRISMSPWVDVAAGAQAVGRDYIFSSKPNPALLAGESWNPQAARASIRDVLTKTRGCTVEFIMKDTRTCRRDPQRITEWTRIAMEEVQR
jgi:hypothetical protein